MIDIDKLKSVTKIVTHDSCADGRASALILHDVLPQAEIEFVQYGTGKYENLCPEEDGFCAHGRILFVDIAPYVERDKSGALTGWGRKQALAWVDAGAIVLDHHKGSKDLVALFGENGVFADEKERPGVSGARLAYQEVWRRLRPRSESGQFLLAGPDASDPRVLPFAQLAGVYDTWQKPHVSAEEWRRAREQAFALLFWPWERLKGGSGEGVLWDHVFELMGVGEVLVEQHDAKVAKAVAEAYRFEAVHEKGAVRVVMLQGDTPIANDANELIGRDADLVVGFGHYTKENAPMVKFSCRSYRQASAPGESGKVFDCNALARTRVRSSDPITSFMSCLDAYLSEPVSALPDGWPGVNGAVS